MTGSRDHKISMEEDQIDRIETNLAKIEEQEKEHNFRFEIAKAGGVILFCIGFIFFLSKILESIVI